MFFFLHYYFFFFLTHIINLKYIFLNRSKAEVPSLNSTPTLTTNDIVINKLAQILSYLRAGNRKGKKGKRMMPENRREEAEAEPELRRNNIDDSIYGDIGNCLNFI